MKNITSIILLLLCISCKKDNTVNVDKIVTDIKENTTVEANEGSGKIILNCNGTQIIAEGIAGAVTSMGELMIAIKDKTNPTKVFTINFNNEQFPENGKVYQIKPKDYTSDKNPANEVSVGLMEGLPNNKMNIWETKANSGTLQFTVKGNEIKCTLENIKLDPSPVYNADDLNKEGILSGQLTIYKN